MKYLVVVLVIAIALWLMLRSRRRPPAQGRSDGSEAPQAMVVCRHCGVHLPRADAVADRTGDYCTEAHRLAGPVRP